MVFNREGAFLKHDNLIWYNMIYLSFMKQKGLVFTYDQFTIDIDFKSGTIFNSKPSVNCSSLGFVNYINDFVSSVVIDFQVNFTKSSIGYRWYFDYIDETRYLSELSSLMNFKVPLRGSFKFK